MRSAHVGAMAGSEHWIAGLRDRQGGRWGPLRSSPSERRPCSYSCHCIATPSHYEFKSLRESLQSQGLLLKGLAEMIPKLMHRLLVLIGLVLLFNAGRFLFEPNAPHYLLLILSSCCMGFGLGLKPLSDRSIRGEDVMHRYQSSFAHAEPLRRFALLGLTAMGVGQLDALRNLTDNVEADAAAADRPTPAASASRPPAAAPAGRAASG